MSIVSLLLLILLLIIIFFPILVGLIIKSYLMFKLRSPGGIPGLLQTILNAVMSGNKTYDQPNNKTKRQTYSNHVWSNQSDSEQNASKMIKCAKCQLYIPENEAINAKGKYYCCHAHANSNSP